MHQSFSTTLLPTMKYICTHQPYATSSYKNSDTIVIAIQQQDHCILPSNSILHIQGKLTKNNGAKSEKISLVNNAFAFLFSEKFSIQDKWGSY